MTIHIRCWYCIVCKDCHAENTKCPVGSEVLKRLVEEVRNDKVEEPGRYDRVYNRHNRS